MQENRREGRRGRLMNDGLCMLLVCAGGGVCGKEGQEEKVTNNKCGGGRFLIEKRDKQKEEKASQ